MSYLHVRPTKKKDKKGKIKNRYQMIINTYKNGRRFYKAETFDSEKEAKAWERKMLRGIDEGSITKESLSEGDCLMQWKNILLLSCPTSLETQKTSFIT